MPLLDGVGGQVSEFMDPPAFASTLGPDGNEHAWLAVRANDILELRGVRSFTARIITCPPRRNVSTWLKLERALLLGFKEKFGEVPKCNSHGKRMKETDEFRYFRKKGVLRVVDDLS